MSVTLRVRRVGQIWVHLDKVSNLDPRRELTPQIFVWARGLTPHRHTPTYLMKYAQFTYWDTDKTILSLLLAL